MAFQQLEEKDVVKTIHYLLLLSLFFLSVSVCSLEAIRRRVSPPPAPPPASRLPGPPRRGVVAGQPRSSTRLNHHQNTKMQDSKLETSKDTISCLKYSTQSLLLAASWDKVHFRVFHSPKKVSERVRYPTSRHRRNGRTHSRRMLGRNTCIFMQFKRINTFLGRHFKFPLHPETLESHCQELVCGRKELVPRWMGL
jgi:hypothetical protein